MSIATRTGDDGTTALMFNRRVSKAHPRVAAYGSVDELNTAIGMARATATQGFGRDHLLAVQKDLVILMGEMATLPEDRPRYLKEGFKPVTPELTARLDQIVKQIEANNVSFKGWATPGQTVHSAALDMARTTCRRAERHVCALHDATPLQNPEILVYLNRLSDALWLLARWAEGQDDTSKA